ncbi:hypothetical protein HDU84_005809 [Entophlyctis sp. JEL0112]|nr:hypothetical protein HDU84_005809 [Entophlyctis sp. JEL0112]
MSVSKPVHIARSSGIPNAQYSDAESSDTATLASIARLDRNSEHPRPFPALKDCTVKSRSRQIAASVVTALKARLFDRLGNFELRNGLVHNESVCSRATSQTVSSSVTVEMAVSNSKRVNLRNQLVYSDNSASKSEEGIHSGRLSGETLHLEWEE